MATNKKSDMDVTARQFIYGEKDKTCKSCLRPMKTTEEFLRHVSHKQLCISFYGEDFIQAVRNEQRKESKRKWAEANEELIKAKTPKKSYYVPNKVKFSETGRAFGRVFRSVFNPTWEDAKEWLKKEGDKLFLLRDEKVADILDEAFERGVSDAIQNGNPLTRILNPSEWQDDEDYDENDDLDYAFSMIESRYNSQIKFHNGCDTFSWKTETIKRVSNRLYDSSLNKAFLKFFDEGKYKAWLMDATDYALDEIFFNLIVNNYFKEDLDEKDLEQSMACTFGTLLHENIAKKAEKEQLQTQIKSFLCDILKKKIRFECNLEYSVNDEEK